MDYGKFFEAATGFGPMGAALSLSKRWQARLACGVDADIYRLKALCEGRDDV